MSTYSNERSLAGEILVKLVLQCNERLVSALRELDIPQNRSGDIWPYSGSLGYGQTLRPREIRTSYSPPHVPLSLPIRHSKGQQADSWATASSHERY